MTTLNDFENQYFKGMAGELGNSIGLSEVDGKRRVIFLGNNPTIDTATVPEDVVYLGGVYPFITTPVNLEIVSTNAGDTAAASIAVFLILIDANYNEVIVPAVVPNGLTPVAIPGGPYRSVNIAQIVDTAMGAVRSNLGDITIRDAGGGTARAIIPIGTGQTRKCHYMVPKGYVMNINQIYSTINRGQGSTPFFASFQVGILTKNNILRFPLEYGISSETPGDMRINPGAVLFEGETFFVRCVYVSNNQTNVSVTANGILNRV